jgi:crotonobetainyl-CoA:carnitine CoA-transferase CaiB-like acyl-CoA transferase
MQEVFQGLKVIDSSSVLAGPSVGMFFAELGAHVIKIENPKQGGDVTRSWKTNSEQEGSVSAYWSSINYKKEIRFLNLADSNDRNELEQLLASADILLTNFKSGDAAKFQLEPLQLFQKYPSLIQASIYGFSSKEDRVAYDVVVQAETGFMYMNGDTSSAPTKMPVALMDVLAAHQLKEAILIALYSRLKTGKGKIISCSLERAGIASLINQASNYLMSGTIAKRAGSLHPNIAPYGEIISSVDKKQIVLAIGSDRQFGTLCNILSCPEVATDPRFVTNQQRVSNRILLLEKLQEKALLINADQLMKAFIENDVPAGLIKDMAEVLGTPVAQEMIREETIEGQHTRRITSIAFEDLTPQS